MHSRDRPQSRPKVASQRQGRRQLARLVAPTSLALLLMFPGLQPRTAGAAPLDTVWLDSSSDPCISAAVLQNSMRAWLGPRAVDPRLRIRVRSWLDGGPGAEFWLQRDGADVAHRSFPALPGGCQDRRAALGLAMALAVDHNVLASLGVTPFTTSPPSTSTPTSGVVPHARLVLGGGFSGDWLPGSGALGTMGLELKWHHFVLGGSALASIPVERELGEGHVRMALLAGRLDLCLERRMDETKPGGLHSLVCAGAAAGVVTADGRGFDRVQQADLPWGAALLRLALGIEQDSLGLLARIFLEGRMSPRVPTLEVVDFKGKTLQSMSLPAAGLQVGLQIGARAW